MSQPLQPTETKHKEEKPRRHKGGGGRPAQTSFQQLQGDQHEHGWGQTVWSRDKRLVCTWGPWPPGASGWQSAGREGRRQAAQSQGQPGDGCAGEDPSERTEHTVAQTSAGRHPKHPGQQCDGQCVGAMWAANPSALLGGRGADPRPIWGKSSTPSPTLKNVENRFLNKKQPGNSELHPEGKSAAWNTKTTELIRKKGNSKIFPIHTLREMRGVWKQKETGEQNAHTY